jgi:streptogramin lyase
MKYPQSFVSLCPIFLLAVVSLTGCSGSFDPALTTPIAQPSEGGISATLMGGRQPISGAHVYLYAADATAYGHASDSLLVADPGATYPTTVDGSGNYYITTDSSGNFYVSAGEYACTQGSQVYLYAVGGNPGAGTNSAAGLMSILGQCGASSSFPGVTYVTMNEASTVAAAYAIAGYAVDATHVASSGTTLAKAGIATAFANAANLYTLATGVVLTTTPNGNGTVPQALIYSLANSLAGCINSSGPSSIPCTLVLGNAKSLGATGTTPTDTVTAAINIAHYPGNAVATILSAAPSSGAPYQPILGATPNDLTVGISFTGGGISKPRDVAIDGSGNVWITSDTANAVTKLSSLGVVATGSPFSVTDASYVAIDSSGNAWVTSPSANHLYEVTTGNSVVSVTRETGLLGANPMTTPEGIAFDASGNIWVASRGNSVLFELGSTGSNALLSPFSDSCLSDIYSVAIDGSNNVWNSTTKSNVCEIGSLLTLLGVQEQNTTTGLSTPNRLAIDGSGNVWAANTGGNSVAKMSSAAVNATGSPFSGGGLSTPFGIAVDGLGNVWLANNGNSSVSEFTSAGVAASPSTGYKGGNQSGSENIAVDGAGDVWVTNITGNSVTELVGAGVPVTTPLSAAVKANTLGTRP